MEGAVGAPHRFTQDYKSLDFESRRHIRRTPWFVAGVGIPLICVAFILPDDESPQEAALSAALMDTTSIELPAAEPADIKPATNAELPPAAPAASEQPPLSKPTILTVRSGDSLDRLFKRNELSRSDLANIMNLDEARKYLRLVKPGDEILVHESNGQIVRLQRQISLSEILSIELSDESYSAEIIEQELEAQPVRASGTINSSLFLAAADAGISDRVIMNLAGIFAWDVDFVLDIREGDQFTLVYEEFWKDGKRIGEGDILAAEFINQGESYRAIRYKDPSGQVGYFTPEGRSMRKAFLRAPLSFSRISSNFNPKRRHPKLNTIRAHKGVDYAAPKGTPVKAAGDGKIIHRGTKGGYGSTVIIQHGGNVTTLYAHLSRFSKARHGTRVRQGDVIGYVGSTGLATGPHLHYEYRRNGVHLNPRTVKLPDAEPINNEHMPAFQQAAASMLLKLDGKTTLVAADNP